MPSVVQLLPFHDIGVTFKTGSITQNDGWFIQKTSIAFELNTLPLVVVVITTIQKRLLWA